MTKVARRMGRPPKPAGERKRNNLTIRVRDSLRKTLMKDAAAHQRSISEEAEHRLEQSDWVRVILQKTDDEGIRADLDALIEAQKVVSHNQIALGKNFEEFQRTVLQQLEDIKARMKGRSS